MKKNLYMVLVYLAVSIFVFAIGIQSTRAASDADADPQIAKCNTEFTNCTLEGECSYTVRRALGKCKITCYNTTPSGTVVATDVDCGKVKTADVEDPIPL